MVSFRWGRRHELAEDQSLLEFLCTRPEPLSSRAHDAMRELHRRKERLLRCSDYDAVLMWWRQTMLEVAEAEIARRAAC